MLELNSRINTKVFIHDSNEKAVSAVCSLCDGERVMRVKSVDVDVLEFLAEPNIFHSDISAIFLSEAPDSQGLTGFHIAEKIQKIRGCLPIFLRKEDDKTDQSTDEDVDQYKLFVGCYSLSDPGQLQRLVDRYLFGVHYPVFFVDRIRAIGTDVISDFLKNVHIISSTPFLLRNYAAKNSLVSMIPLDTCSGSGYLLFKIREDDLFHLVRQGNTALDRDCSDLEEFQQLVSEIINLMWGKLRQALSGDDFKPISTAILPVIVDCSGNSINFGTSRPQLCFRYLVFGKERAAEPLVVDFSVVFHLGWDPEKANVERSNIIKNGLDSGELELLS